MRYFILCLVLLCGCATPQRPGELAVRDQPSAEPRTYRMMIVYVPQTDDAAATWLKWFETYPDLRMMMALSPRFTRLAKDPALKSRVQALEKEGRLELALQIPNAPLLPLLAENPPYGFTEDIVQLIAQSKAGFYKTWNFLPKGLVLPFGAASPRLLSMLERSGFSWIVASLGQGHETALFQLGPLQVWDGSSTKGQVRVWDERQSKGRLLEGWMKELSSHKGVNFLPRDGEHTPSPLPLSTLTQRTWDGSDWSLWTGDPDKSAAWNALQRTREALEKYKNSGQASVTRLDAAFNEIYSAQNSNYFASAGNMNISPALKEEREHEFQATLLAIYRMIGFPPPDDLFTASATVPAVVKPSSTSISSEIFPDGGERVVIHDAVGDALTPGGGDLESLAVRTTTDSTHWTVTLASGALTTPVEIYVDLNAQPHTGTSTFLPGRSYSTSARDAWEYALAFSGQEATLYRTRGGGSYGDAQTFPVVMEGPKLRVTLPEGVMRGRPSRWGYQVLVGQSAVSDLIDPLEVPQKDLWQALSNGNRHDIPFVRIKRN